MASDEFLRFTQHFNPFRLSGAERRMVMLIGEERVEADRVAEQGKIEDLSKLKGPWKWAWSAFGVVGVLAVVMAISGIYFLSGRNPVFFLFCCAFFFCVVACIALAKDAIIEYKLWWYTENGKLKVANKDPMCAQGLVIEVWIKTCPSVTLYWGVKRWKYAGAEHRTGSSYVSNKDGETMRATGPSANVEGLTTEIWLILENFHCWTIVPCNHGRVLRLVDIAGLCRDISVDDTGINLQEILSSRNWGEYNHKQAEQLADLQEKKARADKALDETRGRLLVFLYDVVSRRKLPRIAAESLRLEHALLRLIYTLLVSGSPSQREYAEQFQRIDYRLGEFRTGQVAVENPFKLEKDTAKDSAPVVANGSALQGEVRAS